MYEEDELIPVMWVNKYHWCPRMIYFEGVLGYEERVTELMEQGRLEHKDEERKEKRRKTVEGERVERKWKRFHVASERLGMKGLVDLVVETGSGLAVVEVKKAEGRRGYREGHLYQAVAYAMLAEERLSKPVRFVILKYLKDEITYKIRLTEEMKKHVMWTLRRIRKILNEERLPAFREKRLCRSCGYARICGRI